MPPDVRPSGVRCTTAVNAFHAGAWFLAPCVAVNVFSLLWYGRLLETTAVIVRRKQRIMRKHLATTLVSVGLILLPAGTGVVGVSADLDPIQSRLESVGSWPSGSKPVGNLASQTSRIDEGLGDVNRMAVQPFPVGGQRAGHFPENVRGQMWDPHPGQDQKSACYSR